MDDLSNRQIMDRVLREHAYAQAKRDIKSYEKWNGFDALYIAPSGNVWLLQSQADKIRASGVAMPPGYTIPEYELRSSAPPDGTAMSPSVPGQGPR